MKITGNKWKVVKTDAEATNNANPFDVFASDHQCIAHITNWNPEGNAKLIASAPELLEACKVALKAFNGEYVHWTHKAVSKKECAKTAMEYLMNAIKKATE